MESAQSFLTALETYRIVFPQTAIGEELDKHCETKGIFRKEATKATGVVKFSGANGMVIPSGTRLSTPSSAATSTQAVEFVTTQSATINSGVAYAPVEAVTSGAVGNVLSNTITIMTTPVTGITAVTNEMEMSGGADEESDDSLRARLFLKAKTPSTGGNYGDYINWAGEVNGVGGVAVMPHENGPNSVNVYIIGTDKLPASNALVDAVQEYICPLHELSYENTAFTSSGSGVTTDATQTGASGGDTLKFVYSAAATGQASQPLKSFLPQAGLWIATPTMKVNSIAGSTSLLEVGVYNVSAGAWAKTTYNGSTDAKLTLSASQLATSFATTSPIEFWWNGADNIEFRVKRLQTDTTTQMWFDKVDYVSAFGKETADTIANLGHRVKILPAASVAINVSATLDYASGYDPVDVRARVDTSVREYIKGLAFKTDNDVLYGQIGFAIINNAGVRNYSNLLINGGVANVDIAKKEVAVAGAVTLT
jgi:uncharacterized phage protein gp47/JayE